MASTKSRFNPDDGHYILPSCNTPCRTAPVSGAPTGAECSGIVELSGSPPGPFCYDRGAEQRHYWARPRSSAYDALGRSRREPDLPADSGNRRYRAAVRPNALRFVR